ncbi:hypothetical protein PG997_007179 [Apiospora hydei]|uniref:Uncharacterized protein n=1 Tax=Apiospora hydei TaxID=1337664 RepID=A0ABR1W7A0_9PEZI
MVGVMGFSITSAQNYDFFKMTNSVGWLGLRRLGFDDYGDDTAADMFKGLTVVEHVFGGSDCPALRTDE